jgi:hypothetical protein
VRLCHFGWMVKCHLIQTGQLHLGDSPEHDLYGPVSARNTLPVVVINSINNISATG